MSFNKNIGLWLVLSYWLGTGFSTILAEVAAPVVNEGAKKSAQPDKAAPAKSAGAALTLADLGHFIEPPQDQQRVLNPYFQKQLDAAYSLKNGEGKELIIGSIAPTSGAVSLIGQDIIYGVELVFNKLNSQGGIDGNLVKFKAQDSENEIMVAKDQLQTLWQSSSTFLGLFGTELVTYALELVKKQQLCLLFPVCGDEVVRSLESEYLFNFRASLKQEIAALLTYSTTKLFRRKIAIFYEDSLWGEAGAAHAESILKTLGYKVYAKASYPANTVEIIPAVTKVVEQSPSAVLCIANAMPTYNFVIQALKRGLKNCKFLGLGEMAPIQDILYKSRGIKLITSSVVPSPFKSKIPLAVQYRQDMGKFFANKNFSQFFFEGYVIASILSQLLKSIAPAFKLADLRKAFLELKNTDFGGISLDFDSKNNNLSQNVWINIGDDKDWPMFTIK